VKLAASAVRQATFTGCASKGASLSAISQEKLPLRYIGNPHLARRDTASGEVNEEGKDAAVEVLADTGAVTMNRTNAGCSRNPDVAR
jgi:hypothetical protein